MARTRRKKTSTADDLIEMVSLLPWWAGVALALVAYFLLHAWSLRLAATVAVGPTAAAGLVLALVHAGQFALPFLCLVGAAASAWKRRHRKALVVDVAAGKTPDVLGDMSWQEFEMLVGEGFRMKGYQVVEAGGGGADGGIDLVLRKAGERHLVQCKQWRAYKVGVAVVRELYGVMAASGAASGYVVTSGRFTDEARAFAKGRNVQLMDGDALFELIRSARNAPPRKPRPVVAPAAAPAPVAASRPSPACPRCSGPMVRRVARKGAYVGDSFWGCVTYPKCKGTA